jgi:hypothetical protein
MARKIAATVIAGLLGGWLALWLQQLLIDNRVIGNEPCRDVIGEALCAAATPSGWIALLAAVVFGTATYLLLRSKRP